MNNHRLLTGLLVVSLWSGGVCVMAGNRQVVTMEELFRIAETNSAQLRPSFTNSAFRQQSWRQYLAGGIHRRRIDGKRETGQAESYCGQLFDRNATGQYKAQVGRVLS